MAHPLDGCWAKIERAKEQIQNLNNEINVILTSNDYRVVGEHEFEKRRYVFRVLGPPVPLRISVLTGEIVHHLRSVLDHIVWALASKNGLTPDKRITFPVSETPEKFKEAVKNGIIKGVSRSLHSLIESLQPYRSDDPSNSILRIVHDLDMADKHRLLLVVTHAMRPGTNILIDGELTSDVSLVLATPPQAGPFYRAIEDGVEVHWLAYEASTEPKWHIKNDFSVQIAFDKVGSGEREPIIPILVQLCGGIEGTVQFFEPHL